MILTGAGAAARHAVVTAEMTDAMTAETADATTAEMTDAMTAETTDMTTAETGATGFSVSIKCR